MNVQNKACRQFLTATRKINEETKNTALLKNQKTSEMEHNLFFEEENK